MISTPGAEPESPASAGPARVGTSPPFSLILGLISGITVVLVAQGSFRDVDVYWHLIAGHELASGLSPSELGLTWSYAPDPLPWTSTQWIGEWLFHLLHELGGWTALAVYRTVTAVIVIAILAATTLRGRPAVLAGFPYVIGLIAIGAFSQERTQQFSYIGAAALGGALVAGLAGRRLPRWWMLVPATILWANLHGAWILMPMTLALVALGRWLDNGPRDAAGRRAGVLFAATLASGLVSPAGLANVTAIFRFAGATDVIQEWQAVTPTEDVGILTLLLLLLILVAWARPVRVPRGEVLATLALVTFAWTAWRNVVVAILMIVPLVAHRLTMAYPSFSGRAEPRWSARGGVVLAGLFSLVGFAMIPSQPHLPTEEYPFALYEKLATQFPNERVLNDYNLSGQVLYFGGEGVQVGIDGRTDRYGAQYIEAYLGMMNLKGDWQALFAELAPTSALLKEEDALAHVLVAERGWKVVGSENDYVLLVPPEQ